MKTTVRPVPSMDAITALAKRRGFIFQSSELYGGVNGTWDYGPVGVELKRNVREAWWRDTVTLRDDVVGVETAIIMHPDVWRASGHVENFHDLMVDCKTCKKRWRADHLKGDRCPSCGNATLTEPRAFNMMFRTYIGAMEDASSETFLRPETAQGMFVDFKLVYQAARKRPPFGIAQIGKSFRNEITPGNFTFRSREFEQMEMEFFVPPFPEEEVMRWYRYWVDERYDWFMRLGMQRERLHKREYAGDELAHYSKATTDLEYEFPFGTTELEGIAHRGTYDLAAHVQASGKDLAYFDEESKEKYLPAVIEPALGVDRALLAFLIDAYEKEEDRTVLHLHPRLAPYKVAVFPLVRNKPDIVALAAKIEAALRPVFRTTFDDSGNVGKRYYRQDEIGTPYCVTVDYESLEQHDVTVRDRDSKNQVRVKIDGLEEYLHTALGL
ncbi:MAG TPA: glycine--tRNA ligase [Candidatus Eremiobacteraceae bacterium]|nr:glycine--tRNA ligase [Candidatus Eremiobacteraceae bacterium]